MKIDLTEKLQNLGKKGHGLCGKNADLEYGGQIKVLKAYYENSTLTALVRPYASIVPADKSDFYPDDDDPAYNNETAEEKATRDYETYMDYATELVCGEDWPGEWDGDYWVLNMGDQTITLNVQSPEDPLDVAWQSKAVALLYDAIFAHCAGFQQSMGDLARALEKTNMGAYLDETWQRGGFDLEEE